MDDQKVPPAAVSVITRHFEFDAGHRIPEHDNKCRNVHGHRYQMNVTVAGRLHESGSETGMVMDYGKLKELVNAAVVDVWDHGFLVWAHDTLLREFFAEWHDHKTVVLDQVPTAENLVAEAARLIDAALKQGGYSCWLKHVTLWETPNCSADWLP